jgi:hypothetical protein
MLPGILPRALVRQAGMGPMQNRGVWYDERVREGHE